MNQSERTFKLLMSERCFRFKPDALPSHAPQKPGVYEFVTFDAQSNPTVLFVGYTLDGTVYQALSEHLTGKKSPTAANLFGAAKDIYFDYVADADISDISDLKDIAGALIAKHKPRFNTSDVPTSGRYLSVAIQEVD